jgi:signal transduction histidine kinase
LSNSVSHPTLVSCDPDCQKIEAMRQLITLYGHEITNQLTVIIGRSELALSAVDRDSALRSYLSEIQDSARRVAVLNRKLLAVPEA